MLNGFIETIGKTPLIKLRKLSEETGCIILGKAEFLNPGGSVKDRTAWGIVKDAEERGLLEAGGIIIEGTAGNTGIGLAHVAAARGYKTIIVMPETQSQEKKDTLTMVGADLRLVPAVPYKNPNNYVRYSERLANEIKQTAQFGVIWANQFDNTANRKAHYETTGPEIWEDTNGTIDAFTCAVGTGGSLAGIGMALKERDEDIHIVLSDPDGSALFHHYKNGELKADGSSITEGIGQGRITKNLQNAPVDDAQQITDSEALNVVFDLMQYEGLLVGGSAGLNVAGAAKLARKMGPGHTIVTLLCDSGARYQSKIFNPIFLREKGLPTPPWLL